MVIEAEKYFPFEQVASRLTDWGKKVERSDNGIVWATKQGRSSLIFQPAGVSTTDGLTIDGYIECRHDYSALDVDYCTPAEAAYLNKHASLGALLPPSNGVPAAVVTRASIFAGDREAVDYIYAPFIATDAYIQPVLFPAIASGDARFGPAYFGASDSDKPPPYGVADFEELREFAQSKGFVATASPGGFGVEFEWDPGAISALHNLLSEGLDYKWSESQTRTALCQILTTEKHPNLGRGLLASLRLPLNFSSQEQLVKVVTWLNRFEASSYDMPPLFGAWCIGPQNTVAFVCFVQNELCIPGLHWNLFTWMYSRAYKLPRSIEELTAV